SVGPEPRDRERQVAARAVLVGGILRDLPGAREPVGGARVVDVHARARVLRAVAPPRAVVVEGVREEVPGALGRAPEGFLARLLVRPCPAEAHLARVEDGR